MRERVVAYKVDMTLRNSRVHYKIQIMQNHCCCVRQLHEHRSNGTSSAKNFKNFIINAVHRTKRIIGAEKRRDKNLLIFLNKFST